MIQRCPFRIFVTALNTAGGGHHAYGAEVAASAPMPDAPKSVHWKAHCLSARFAHYQVAIFRKLV
jgi:hypothetical protein